MKSNFEFLKKDMDTEQLYQNASAAEKHYTDKIYDSEFSQIRKVIENITSMVLDFNYFEIEDRSTFNDQLRIIKNEKLIEKNILDLFYNLKNYGNSASHSLSTYTQEEALKGLKNLRSIMEWYAKKYIDSSLVFPKFVEPIAETTYTTAERKLIYVQTANNNDGKWPAYDGLEKIGEASTPSDDLEADWTKNSDFLRTAADKRISEYMKTAGVPYKLQWAELAWIKDEKRFFHDYDVHNVLQRSGIKKDEITSGNEWYRTDVETVKKAIEAVKNGQLAIEGISNKGQQKIILRPEQQDAVEVTRKGFTKHNKMLWNAKMRFGKTLTALQLIKENKYKKILIMTHRPVVSDSWFEDFDKMNLASEGYEKASKTIGQRLDYLVDNDKSFIYFASIQDLRGSSVFGGKAGDKNELIADIDWDLVIIDEAHEGTQTELAEAVINGVMKKNTKQLELSGTPFNLLGQYDDDQVYTWDYVMEQEAKYNWSKEHPNERNPYEGLPKVSMYTFEMQNKNDFADESKSFNFKEFFKVDEDGKFVYESKVNQFLDNITTKNSKTNYPFSTEDFRNELRHTLWMLPGITEAKALKSLMDKHPIFGSEYKIINIVDQDDNVVASDGDLKRVHDAITDQPSETKTITLTVRKLTTGVNVKEWTAVVFLSNTNSAMQYLQAAFRAQTPFSDEKLGMKTNCYIFDFAPDRALTVMAESANLNAGAGKRISSENRKDMERLLNFLPIIGEKGQGMKEFKVDDLLTKIKRVYAEKAVRSGFDDDSLYSDELLMSLSENDLDAFNDLKAIVGTTQAEKKPISVTINNQGLDDKEYDDSQKAQKKPKRERTPEEQVAFEKLKLLNKQKKTMISVLRGISIRIPMMIYGMPIDISEDVDLDAFINNVDEKSWAEFMPKGIIKDKFRDIAKYYDAEVFVEAGRIIRQKVKSLDLLDPIQRAEELANIFGTFKNPDKETVLTPWRVVNMQLSKTIGGYSFFNDDFSSMYTDGIPAGHWVENRDVENLFLGDKTFLEINSKTGLYPLYVATSLYKVAFEKLNETQAGKFSVDDEENIWKSILEKNIFVIAKTPMAKTITERTLMGYREMKSNIEYISNVFENGIDAGNEEILRRFNKLKFDVIVGNPPYQNGRQQVYANFFVASRKIANTVSLIFPIGWQDPKSNNGLKLINSIEVKEDRQIVWIDNIQNAFAGVKGAEWTNIVLWIRGSNNNLNGMQKIYTNSKDAKIIKLKISSDEISKPFEIIQLARIVTSSKNFLSIKNVTSAREPYGLTTNSYIDNEKYNLPPMTLEKNGEKDIKIYIKSGMNRWVSSDFPFPKKGKAFGNFKVYIPYAWGNLSLSNGLGGAYSDIIVAKPFEATTGTYIESGCFDNETTAKRHAKYLMTKFARALLYENKNSIVNATAWGSVPIQDFSEDWWDEPIYELDERLFDKYNIPSTLRRFVNDNIQKRSENNIINF